jgi:hypothetical protein
MRLAVTLLRLHGEKDFQVVSGPDVPIDEQIAAIKELARSGREHPTIAQAQLWNSSTGLTKRFKFRQPGETPASGDDEDADGSGDETEADLAAQAAGADPKPLTRAEKRAAAKATK